MSDDENECGHTDEQHAAYRRESAEALALMPPEIRQRVSEMFGELMSAADEVPPGDRDELLSRMRAEQYVAENATARVMPDGLGVSVRRAPKWLDRSVFWGQWVAVLAFHTFVVSPWLASEVRDPYAFGITLLAYAAVEASVSYVVVGKAWRELWAFIQMRRAGIRYREVTRPARDRAKAAKAAAKANRRNSK